MSVYTAEAQIGEQATSHLMGSWKDVFRYDAMIHLAMIASITGATFQGYLKDRIAGPLPYAIADAFFVAAVIIWFGGLAIRHLPISGPGYVPAILLMIIVVPAFYLAAPGTPLVVKVAGLRAWSELPVGCLIALTVIRSAGQVRAYIGLILVLCLITAIYGIYQYQTGPESALEIGPLAELRHGATPYYFTGERIEFRAFSTFTFPAPFAGMMVFGMLLAAGIVMAKDQSRRLRWICAAIIPVLFIGMTVSGTRAALIIFLAGLLVLGWYRGLGIRQFVLIPLMLIAMHIATLITAGQIIERYRSVLLREDLVWTYLYAPLTVAARALTENPFGLGLGRTGVGVPFQITRSMPSGYFVFSDGDIGRAAVELGVVGLFLLAAVVVGLIPYAIRAAGALVHTISEDVALGIGALVISTGVLVLIGSPLTTAPHGTIWWFFLGALLKLAMLHRDAPTEAPA